jgi:hypothetical protein
MKALIAGIILSLGFVTAAHAAQCGDVVPAGGSLVLTGDLSCPNRSFAIKFAGSGSLWCGGHTIAGNQYVGSVGIDVGSSSEVYIHDCNLTGWRDSAVRARGASFPHSQNVFVLNSNLYGNTLGVRYDYVDNGWVQYTELHGNTTAIIMSNTIGGGTFNANIYDNSTNGFRCNNCYGDWHNASPYLIWVRNGVSSGGYDGIWTAGSHHSWVEGARCPRSPVNLQGYINRVRYDSSTHHNTLNHVTTNYLSNAGVSNKQIQENCQ